MPAHIHSRAALEGSNCAQSSPVLQLPPAPSRRPEAAEEKQTTLPGPPPAYKPSVAALAESFLDSMLSSLPTGDTSMPDTALYSTPA